MPADHAQPTTVDHSSAPAHARLRRLLPPAWVTRNRVLRTAAWIVVIGVWIAVLFGYLWPQDYDNTALLYVMVSWAAFMVMTFVFHIGLAALLIALIAAWARGWKLAAASALLAVVAAGPSMVDALSNPPHEATGPTLTVMSVNLLASNRHTAPVIEQIQDVHPDILLLQEYSLHWHRAMHDALGEDYFYTGMPRPDSFGIAIYSRRPFIGQPQVESLLGRVDVPQIRVVVRLAGRRLVIYNIHLLPPYRSSYVDQRLQFADLLDRLRSARLPVIAAGDFNFTSTSPNADALRRIGFRDAHSIAGAWRGTTWPMRGFFSRLPVPKIRIDHVYLPPGLTADAVRTGLAHGSDHRPVIAEIGFARLDP